MHFLDLKNGQTCFLADFLDSTAKISIITILRLIKKKTQFGCDLKLKIFSLNFKNYSKYGILGQIFCQMWNTCLSIITNVEYWSKLYS